MMLLDVASNLIPLFHIGDKILAADVMQTVIFNEKIFRYLLTFLELNYKTMSGVCPHT